MLEGGRRSGGEALGHPERRPRYLPAEDTYLLMEALAACGGDSCLEIGFGSGALLAGVAGRFRLAVGTDILHLEDAKQSRAASVDLVLADAAKCFREGVFDLVFFNPPYLPSDRIEDAAVDGGRGGTQVPISFLREALRAMKENGTVMVLLSEAGDVGSFLECCKSLGLYVEPVAERNLFYEKLVVFKIRREP
jgi:release factor glutamine methyltransferase